RKKQYPDLPHDESLFEKLRELRKKLANELNVPPYIVFGDTTLISMAHLKPETPDQMLEVNGVGQVKLERFGEVFLHCIKEGMSR
ncbi:MAG: HRDC domain-containing protein, partial [Mariprofundaceae bacterium]